MTSFFHRFYKAGKVPDAFLPSMQQEGIFLRAEGLRGSVTYRNFQAPGRRYRWKRTGCRGSIVLTQKSLFAFVSSKPIVAIPWYSDRIQQLDCSLEKHNCLLFRFEASTIDPDWSGTIEIRFFTPYAVLCLETILRRRPKNGSRLLRNKDTLKSFDSAQKQSIQKRAIARSLTWALIASPILSLSTSSPALANCPDSVGSFSYYEPAVGRLWVNLQDQTDYPWGSERPYGELNRDRITLTPEFDTLTGSEKDQVIDQLRLGYEEASLSDFLSPEERARSRSGTFPPYTVSTHDGRLIQSPYDGCTLMRTLTERERYIWQYSRLPYDSENNRQVSPEALRNAGNPHWRTVRFSISPEEELALRLSFWEAVGYDKAEQKWWIAWVPEQGHFEINVAEDHDPSELEQFWQVASQQYAYVVLTDKGSFLAERLATAGQ